MNNLVEPPLGKQQKVIFKPNDVCSRWCTAKLRSRRCRLSFCFNSSGGSVGTDSHLYVFPNRIQHFRLLDLVKSGSSDVAGWVICRKLEGWVFIDGGGKSLCGCCWIFTENTERNGAVYYNIYYPAFAHIAGTLLAPTPTRPSKYPNSVSSGSISTSPSTGFELLNKLPPHSILTYLSPLLL